MPGIVNSPQPGCWIVCDHAARLEVRVGQELGGREAGAGRHAGLAERVHHLVLGMLHRPALDQRVDLGLVGGAPLRIRPLRRGR